MEGTLPAVILAALRCGADRPVRIATFNVNGINGRLPSLLARLKEAAPGIVCLQELKAPDEKFPEAVIRAAGYGAIWHGQKSWNGVAILARSAQPMEIRRGLPGDPDDAHSRYIEATVGRRGFIPAVRPTNLCHGPRSLRPRLCRCIVDSPPYPVAKSAMRGDAWRFHLRETA
jgi:hypothetical protein